MLGENMSLKLMYITNKPEIARIAEAAGVDRIFVDMEYIGKEKRQHHMDTVQNHHSIEDVKRIRATVEKAELLVRVNPIHEKTEEYSSSQEEIDAVIDAGADVVMLPYFTTVEEVEQFVRMVGKRAKTLPLLESAKALELVDEILEIQGIDEIFVGLNDLSLDMGKKFMFELLPDGTVEELCFKFKQKGIPYGFGGIASLGKGMLPSEYVIREHYRLGSTCAILSRSFCNTNQISQIDVVRDIFLNGIRDIREFEKECAKSRDYFEENMQDIARRVKMIVDDIGAKDMVFDEDFDNRSVATGEELHKKNRTDGA